MSLLYTDPILGYTITDLTGPSGTNKNYKIKTKLGYVAFYHYFPTDNCQLGSYGSLENILSSSDWKEILISLNKNLARLGGAKPLMLADIKAKATSEAKIEELFKVMSKTPYQSSNGNNMVLYMLDTREITN